MRSYNINNPGSGISHNQQNGRESNPRPFAQRDSSRNRLGARSRRWANGFIKQDGTRVPLFVPRHETPDWKS
jgi:hypothetical protein